MLGASAMITLGLLSIFKNPYAEKLSAENAARSAATETFAAISVASPARWTTATSFAESAPMEESCPFLNLKAT